MLNVAHRTRYFTGIDLSIKVKEKIRLPGSGMGGKVHGDKKIMESCPQRSWQIYKYHIRIFYNITYCSIIHTNFLVKISWKNVYMYFSSKGKTDLCHLFYLDYLHSLCIQNMSCRMSTCLVRIVATLWLPWEHTARYSSNVVAWKLKYHVKPLNYFILHL